MGCLLSKFRERESVNSNELIVNSKTIPLRKIPKMLYFKDIVPTELNFEVQQFSDGQYQLNQSNREIKYNYSFNKKRWTVAQLQSMNYPTFDDSYRVTIGYKEYESILKYEHILIPYDEIPEIDIGYPTESVQTVLTFESQVYEQRETLNDLQVSGLQY